MAFWQCILTVPKETAVRWSSLYNLAEFFLCYEEVLKRYMLEDTKFNITDAQWQELHDLKKVLKPLARATLYFEKSGLCYKALPSSTFSLL